MADYSFKTPAGQTIARELLIAYLNTGTEESPKWSPLGKRVEDSSAEYDWGEETKRDILGSTWTTAQSPIITQTFEPCELDSGDEALMKIWKLAIVDQDAQALTDQDMLIVHMYANSNFAVRYKSCMVKPSSIGGPGGGSVSMPIDVTYGGERTIGSATLSGGSVTFTPATPAASEGNA